MLTPIRRFYGLRWQADMPKPAELGIDLQTLLVIIILVLCYGIVGLIDEAAAAGAQRESATDRADLNRAALLACLNGSAPGLYVEHDNGVRQYLVCSADHYYVSDENIRKDGA